MWDLKNGAVNSGALAVVLIEAPKGVAHKARGGEHHWPWDVAQSVSRSWWREWECLWGHAWPSEHHLHWWLSPQMHARLTDMLNHCWACHTYLYTHVRGGVHKYRRKLLHLAVQSVTFNTEYKPRQYECSFVGFIICSLPLQLVGAHTVCKSMISSENMCLDCRWTSHLLQNGD